MYDVNSMKSFDNLNNWREEFLIQVLLYLCLWIIILLLESHLQKDFNKLKRLKNTEPFFYDLAYLQASPSDPENFPFVVLGNKVDVDGGNSRVVSIT